MRRVLILLLLLMVVGIGAGTYLWGKVTSPLGPTNKAGSPLKVAGTSTIAADRYLYYALKDPEGIMLARALKGADGRPLGNPDPLTLVSPGFGMVGSDSVSQIQLSPDGLYLAINGNRDHGGLVWIYNTQGKTIQPTPAHVSGNFLHWLPGGNGHTFLYRPMFPMGRDAPADDQGWNPGLWLVDAATGSYRNIEIGVPSAFLIDAAPSPDGSRIIYSTTAGLSTGSDTWLMNSDGSRRTHLFKSADDAQSIAGLFAWSPDGSYIAYQRLSDSPTPFLAAGLWVMNSQGAQQRRLAEVDGGHGFPLTWSPDSRKIAYIARTNFHDRRANVLAQSLQSAVGIASVESARTWLVASPEQTGLPLNSNPTWSVDSASIIFTASQPVNRDIGGSPRYWSARVTDSTTKPQVVPITPAIPRVIAAG
jgi:Tol biopolymer transport system component